MLKRLARCIGEFKKFAVLTPVLIVGEAIIECLMPFIIATLINAIEDGAGMNVVLKSGLTLLAMALVSLAFGAAAGFTASKASAGFAKNLRRSIFSKIQGFSFENIDKFSSASLVTRMTTDVSNVQMSFMMIIRTAIRAPFMFIFSIIMVSFSVMGLGLRDALNPALRGS